jgi:hypothetical protein
LPTALAGNVTGGTNVGGFHLVCRPSGVQGADGNAPAAAWYTDNIGDVGLSWHDADSAGFVGVYPVGIDGAAFLATGFVGA